MLIGLVGLKRSGKDTTADYLTKHYDFAKYSLADPMKKACKEIFLFSDEQLWGNDKERIDHRYGCSARRILQIFGTELFQYNIYHHIPEFKIPSRKLWIYRFEQWYHNLMSDYAADYEMTGKYIVPNVVIADVRFEHEAEDIRKLDGIIVRVVRYPLPDNSDQHASETELLEIEEDYTLYGMDNIPTLYKEIDKLMEKLNIIKVD